MRLKSPSGRSSSPTMKLVPKFTDPSKENLWRRRCQYSGLMKQQKRKWLLQFNQKREENKKMLPLQLLWKIERKR